MAARGEKRPLLSEEEDEENSPRSGSPYGAETSRTKNIQSDSVKAAVLDETWWAKNKEKVPGYGMWTMLRQASAYMIYVLLIMLLVYLLNQLDRYTISITARYIGGDLGFGAEACIPDQHSIKSTLRNESIHYSRANLIKHYYPKCLKEKNISACEDYELPLTHDFNDTVCKWGYDGSQGLKYQILAGPVFNNVYPFAGIFMGILADRFNRKILLGISLLFWSLATGATGFAQNYWMLVVFRLLLAIGAAGCTPFAVSIISDYFPQNLRGTAIGVYYWGIYTGYSLSYAIGNSINITLGWPWVFFISAFLGIALTPVVLFTVKEPKRNEEGKTDKRTTSILNSRHKCIEFLKKLLLLLKTFILPGMLMLCIAGGIRNAGGYVWAYNTQSFFLSKGYSDETIASYMSVIPLVGGSLGAILGGVISDFLVKGRGAVARIWVLMISQLLAAPFAAGALLLPMPWCFLSLIPSNIIGEMWVGVASATIVDLAPAIIRTSSIALYLFIITVIGGNFNVLVPPLQSRFKKIMHGSQDAIDRNSLRWAVFFTFPALYVISAFLFLLAFLLMQIDKKITRKCEEQLPMGPTENEESVEGKEADP